MRSSRPKGMDAEAEHTFLFADIVGFTAFTEKVGDDVAADVAVAFKSAAAHAADELGCEVIKDLGDAVMIHGRDAARVLMLALRLARELADEGWCPPLRMGVHSGGAVQRDRDWYGTTVNVAARLAESAGAGEILMSVETRDRLASRTGLTIAERGRRSFKNVAAPLAVFAAA
ncbi:MAG TPA: adenylate/guanylate cyclase domain-containing protein [Solirubrobacteraceae bacterium]|jgi:adenylate cyclase|nr:adenylate/guanylate cyclase domain-containing protein [Solirubrobacteraceae bacterium]